MRGRRGAASAWRLATGDRRLVASGWRLAAGDWRLGRQMVAAAAVILLPPQAGIGGPSAAERAAAPAPRAAPPRFEREVVVSQSLLASEVGRRVLERGGNAVDAAVATAFALAVVHPTAGNVGGGGFLLVRLPGGQAHAFDFRETAPAAARPDMFLDRQGRYDRRVHHHGIAAVGVPGTPAGLELAHRRLGKLEFAELVEPAVKLARGGFTVTEGLAASLEKFLPALSASPAALAQFSRGGRPLRAGESLVQEDLARTLERIRDHGSEGFYRGETAELLLQEMERRGGLMRREDLEAYRALERVPLRGFYRGFEVLGMPPPCSGGTVLLELVNVLEGYDLPAMDRGGSRSSHLIIEAMRRAYADRARWLGDPDRVEVPVDRLTSKEYAAELRRSIDPARASSSSPGSLASPEGPRTTHLSVVDRDLMAAALTTTLEDEYGSRIVVPGAGFLLNNVMGDFNAGPGLTDSSGLIGTPPNLAGPGKRMLSSMCPTIVAREGRLVLVLGSPGGRTIINTVLLVLLGVLDHGLPLQEAVDLPRFHHQWLPDRVLAERGAFSPEVQAALEAMGHRLETASDPQGSVMAVRIHEQEAAGGPLEAGVDRRRPDGGAAGR